MGQTRVLETGEGSGERVHANEIRAYRAAVSRIKLELFGVDRTAKGAYTREFVREFQRFQAPATSEELLEQALASDTVFIGDYHALPQAQEFEARFLEELRRRDRNLVVGVEMVYGRNQRDLERWLAGRITDREFLRKIRYNLEWGYDWESFRRIFEVCRRHRIPVHGVDTDPRGGLRRIRERDDTVAHNLYGLIETYPGRRMVVIFGESHLASSHLPHSLQKLVDAAGRKRRTLTVLQNLDNLFFQLIGSGYQGIEVVKIHQDAYCVFNAPPLSKYQSYRSMLDLWSNTDPDGELPGRAPIVADLVDCLLDFLGVGKYTHRVRCQAWEESIIDAYPTLHECKTPAEIRRIMRLAGVPARHRPEILRHILSKPACYIREMNAIFIRRWRFPRISEVVSRSVNVIMKGEYYSSFQKTHRKLDRFFVKVVEEALAYFGSKVLNHNRSFVREEGFLRGRSSELARVATMLDLESREVRRLLEYHRKLVEFHSGDVARRRPPAWLGRLQRSRSRVKGAVSDLAGHFLGERLHEDYHRGLLTVATIRRLFAMKFTDQPAYKTYLLILRRRYDEIR